MHIQRRFHFRFLLAGGALLAMTSLVGSQPVTSDPSATAVRPYRGWVHVGWFYPKVETSARLDNSAVGIGTQINFEEDIGLEDRVSQGSFQAGYYLTQRWRLSGEYFELKRSNTKTLSREIHWGDEVYGVNATVSAFLNTEVYRLAVGYDIFQKPNSVFGFTFGAHLLRMGVGMDAALNVGSKQEGIETDASTSGLMPIPNIGFYYLHAFSDHWRLDTRIDWFGISVGEWDGSLTSAALSIRYFFTDYVSLGLGAEYFRLNVNYNQESWSGNAKMEFYGPMVELAVRF